MGAMLQEFLVSVLINISAEAMPSALDAIRGWFRKDGRAKQAAQVRELLEDLGAQTREDIERHVAQLAETDGRDISAAQRRELIDVLWNMVRGSRMIMTDGRPRSSYVRCEHLLNQILENIQPARRRGEVVGPGHEYVLERYLGIGSFGEVWMGVNPRDPKRQRAVRNARAFKFFTEAKGDEWIRREEGNLYEIRDKLRGGHPNIVEFHTVAVADQAYPFLEFEYVGGGSLEDWIVEDEPDREPLDVSQIVRDIVEGLAAAHEAGICHRDLKPANILLTEGKAPQAKTTDFGLATTLAGDAGHSMSYGDSSASGVEVGTRMYLPPEVHRPFAEVDPAKQDVFALGVVWYQLIVNELERPPYNFAERLAACGADSHTISVISRCLAHPDDRLPRATSVRDRLFDIVPPTWQPPENRFDVQHIFREYLATVDA